MIQKKNLNPYDFNKDLEHLNNLTLGDVKNVLQHFKKIYFNFDTHEEEVSYSLKGIKFKSKILLKKSKDKYEYYLLKNLNDYLVDENDFKNLDKIKNKEIWNNTISKKKYIIGSKRNFINIYADPEKLSKNKIKNFIEKSEFNTAKNIENKFFDERRDITKEIFD